MYFSMLTAYASQTFWSPIAFVNKNKNTQLLKTTIKTERFEEDK